MPKSKSKSAEAKSTHLAIKKNRHHHYYPEYINSTTDFIINYNNIINNVQRHPSTLRLQNTPLPPGQPPMDANPPPNPPPRHSRDTHHTGQCNLSDPTPNDQA
eukprot:scaffold482_cov98-Skeletonema_dohrnii-CCMP3373.AAC.3